MSLGISQLLSKLRSEPETPHLKRAIVLMEDPSLEFPTREPNMVLVSEALEFWSIRLQHSRRIK
jgi:hypothetical protein